MPNKLLRLQAVIEATGLCRSAVYARIQTGDFPAPVKIGERAAAWPADEIANWIEARIRARDAGNQPGTYPEGTSQFNQYINASSIDRASYNFAYGTPIQEVREGLEAGRAEAIVLINAAINDLAEDLEDLGEVPSGETASEQSEPSVLHDVHPMILENCAKLCDASAFAEAVERSFKVVRDRLRELSGYETGSEAFGKGGLYVRGAAAPNVDQDFNEAVKFLTMAIDRFRNEKSHTSNAKIEDPNRAHHYLILSSLAMFLLDNTEVRR